MLPSHSSEDIFSHVGIAAVERSVDPDVTEALEFSGVPLWTREVLLKTVAEAEASGLGSGAFGVAFLLQRRSGDKPLVVKFSSSYGQRAFFEEVKALCRVGSTGPFQKLIAVCLESECLALVSEFAGTPLADLRVDFRSLEVIATKVRDALLQLHSRGLAHGDVHDANVCVAFDAEGEPSVTLIDFGSAQDASDLAVMVDLGRVEEMVEFLQESIPFASSGSPSPFSSGDASDLDGDGE